MALNKHSKKKHQKLVFELKYLYADLEYHEAVLVDAKVAFDDELKKKLKEDWDTTKPEVAENAEKEVVDFQEPTETPEEKEEEALGETADVISDPDIQALFRKITKLTHPDLCGPTESEAVKQAKVEAFIKAKKAAVENNWYALCQIALELGLELPEFDEKHLKWMEKEIKGIKSKLSQITGSVFWRWFHEENLRETLMNYYLKAVGKNK